MSEPEPNAVGMVTVGSILGDGNVSVWVNQKHAEIMVHITVLQGGLTVALKPHEAEKLIGAMDKMLGEIKP